MPFPEKEAEPGEAGLQFLSSPSHTEIGRGPHSSAMLLPLGKLYPHWISVHSIIINRTGAGTGAFGEP